MNYTHVRERQGPDIFALSNVTLCKSSFITIFIVTQKFIRIKAVGWLAFFWLCGWSTVCFFCSHFHSLTHIQFLISALNSTKSGITWMDAPLGSSTKKRQKITFYRAFRVMTTTPSGVSFTEWASNASCFVSMCLWERYLLHLFHMSHCSLFYHSMTKCVCVCVFYSSEVKLMTEIWRCVKHEGYNT